MRSFSVGQSAAKLRYLELEGSGPPLMMIHGLGCASSFDYPPVAQSKALRHRHVLLVDMFGFGYSDRPDDFGYGISDHAGVIVELVEALQFSAVNLFGHSMGGSVAIEVADRLGDRVGNLILAEANLDSGGGQASRWIASMGEEAYVPVGHPQMIADMLAEANGDWATTLRVAAPRAVFLGTRSLVEGGTPDWRQRFLRHSSRKAFIFGEESLPDPDVEALARAEVLVLTVKDAGHTMGIDNPEGLAEAIAAALD